MVEVPGSSASSTVGTCSVLVASGALKGSASSASSQIQSSVSHKNNFYAATISSSGGGGGGDKNRGDRPLTKISVDEHKLRSKVVLSGLVEGITTSTTGMLRSGGGNGPSGTVNGTTNTSSSSLSSSSSSSSNLNSKSKSSMSNDTTQFSTLTKAQVKSAFALRGQHTEECSGANPIGLQFLNSLGAV